MTPVQQAGFKVGDKFRVLTKGDGFEVGTIITLDRDDGSNYPMFAGPNSMYRLAGPNSDKPGAYMRLSYLAKVVEPEFKVGDRVRITNNRDGGFEDESVGRTGTIRILDGTSLPALVDFNDSGDNDWGKFSEMELIVEAPVVPTATIKQKLEAIDKLVAEVRELLG